MTAPDVSVGRKRRAVLQRRARWRALENYGMLDEIDALDEDDVRRLEKGFAYQSGLLAESFRDLGHALADSCLVRRFVSYFDGEGR